MAVLTPRHLGNEASHGLDDAAFPVAFRTAVKRSGRSLESLRRRLDERGTTVSIATLSYWQSGRSQPQRLSSLEAVAHLEEILGVPRGHLLTKLGPRKRPGPTRELPRPAALPVEFALASRAMEQLGFGAHLELVDLTVHDTLDVDADGVQRVRTIRNVVRAMRDGAQRLPALLATAQPSGERATFTAVSGCHVGRTISHDAEGVFAAEIILDRPLRVDETAAAEHRVTLPRDLDPEQSIEYLLQHRVTELMIWVRFHPDKLPATVETFSVVDGRTTSSLVDLRDSTSVQHVVHRVGPGRVGIRWSF
ncbi:MAG: hypothetical protein WB473_07535 [Pedococcus sp.]